MLKSQTPLEASLTVKPLLNPKAENIAQKGEVTSQTNVALTKDMNDANMRLDMSQSSTKPTPNILSTATTASKKVSLLDQMKEEKLKRVGQISEIKPVFLPNLEQIRDIWNAYTQQLKDANRHTAVTSFQIAEIRVEGNEVVVTNASILNQKIIESESSEVLQIFKQHFNNPDIQLRLEVLENPDDRNKEIEPRFLNVQERFRLMAGDYPAILELKDKLKLELKY